MRHGTGIRNVEIDEIRVGSSWESVTPISCLNPITYYQDFDNDGFKEYVIGNWGTNNKFHPSKDKPLHIYADYLDGNTTFDVVLSKLNK